MNPEYLNFVVDGMDNMFDGVTDPSDRQFLCTASLCRFMNCDSLLDLSETYGISRKRLYWSADTITRVLSAKMLEKIELWTKSR